MASKKDRLSENERFIELCQTEESLKFIVQKLPFADVLQNRCP